MKLHFIEAFTAKIEKMDWFDREYGQLYDVNGYGDETGPIGAFYLKRMGPFWYVGSSGSGI